MASIGRWTSVDPLAELAPEQTPFRYGFNNPILYTDINGMFESRLEAKEYKKANIIDGTIRKQDDGSFALVDKNKNISHYFGSGSTNPAIVIAEKPQSSVSSQIMAFTLPAAAITSQLDSPLPGPADAVAAGEIILGGALALIAYITVDRLYSKTNNDDQMKGGKQNQRDRDFGIPEKDFWR